MSRYHVQYLTSVFKGNFQGSSFQGLSFQGSNWTKFARRDLTNLRLFFWCRVYFYSMWNPGPACMLVLLANSEMQTARYIIRATFQNRFPPDPNPYCGLLRRGQKYPQRVLVPSRPVEFTCTGFAPIKHGSSWRISTLNLFQKWSFKKCELKIELEHLMLINGRSSDVIVGATGVLVMPCVVWNLIAAAAADCRSL